MSISAGRVVSRSRATGGEGIDGIRALKPRPSAGRLSAMLLSISRLVSGGGRGRDGGLAAARKLFRERDVGFGAARSRVVQDHGDAVARRFAQAHVARNHRAIDL